MDRIFANLFRSREATPVLANPKVATKSEGQAESKSGSFQERIVRPRSAQAALTISAVYRAIELRAKTESQFLMQYQRKNVEGGNYIPDMWGSGKTLNYLLQIEPNPIMTAASLFEQIVIKKLTEGNAFVYIERNTAGDPVAFWLASCGGYNQLNGTYNLTYLGSSGIAININAPREDVLHFPNTFRTEEGFWGLSTLRYAIDSLSLVKTETQQSIETAAKGGRVKLIISEDTSKVQAPIGSGMFDAKQVRKYAKQVNDEIYQQDVVSLRGLDKVQNISMSAADMQAIEMLQMGLDDVARFFGTPRPLLMLDTNSHYTTPVNATLEYMTRTIQPDIVEIEQEFSRKLLTIEDFDRRRFHMCEQPLLRLDKESQAKVDEINLRTGAASVNEIRQQYDRPAVEGGDVLYLSTNLAELGSEKLRGNSLPETTKQPINDNQ